MNPAQHVPIIDNTSYLEAIIAFIGKLLPLLWIAAKGVVAFFITISFPLSVFFFIVIIYCVEQLKVIRRKEEQFYDLKVEPAFETVQKGDPALSHRWENVTTHIESPNQNDWRTAIMEADIILDDILTKIGYQGDSVGEKLKRANVTEFASLNDAWEAHKVRNLIAHQGTSFVMTHEEAKRIIGLYKRVFQEFYYI